MRTVHAWNVCVAIWDARKQVLFIARDRLGVKPLYFLTMIRRLYSLPRSKRSVAGCGSVKPELNYFALGDYWRITGRRMIDAIPGVKRLAREARLPGRTEDRNSAILGPGVRAKRTT